MRKKERERNDGTRGIFTPMCPEKPCEPLHREPSLRGKAAPRCSAVRDSGGVTNAFPAASQTPMLEMRKHGQV